MLNQYKEWAKRHPILSLVIAIGAGLLMYKLLGPRMHRGLLFM